MKEKERVCVGALWHYIQKAVGLWCTECTGEGSVVHRQGIVTILLMATHQIDRIRLDTPRFKDLVLQNLEFEGEEEQRERGGGYTRIV